ncbi:hypothetical protein Q3G72_024693 [Acer saccharum]|nr:hypothetical protein Q3G72_024693 [Acer saccharum]
MCTSNKPAFVSRQPTGLGLAMLTACAFALAACSHHQARPPRTSLEAGALLAAPLGPLPDDVTPLVYSLALALDPNRPDFSGTVKISVRTSKPTALIWLHGQELEVGEGYATDAVGMRHRLRYSQVTADGVARLDIEPPLPAGVSDLNLRFAANYNTGLSGLYKVASEEKNYVFSQFEPLSARRAYPCFDEPRFKTPFQIALTVPDDALAISNTSATGQTNMGLGHTTWTFAPTQPLPSYLTVFAVGLFDVAQAMAPINSVRPDTLALRGISTHGRGGQMAFAIGHAAALLEALEQYFQTPYPFDKLDLVAVPDFAASAMENAGAITFRDWLLLMDPTRVSASQKHAYFSVTAHELSHQWFGDSTTMAWWDDLWLNESFATWMGQRTAQQLDPEGHYDWELIEGMHNVMRQDSLAQARSIQQPCPTANDVHSAFDGITYLKGGAILNMFEHFMGPYKFAQGVRSYLQAHPYATATADDFVHAVTQAHGDPNTKGAVYSFLQQTGVPLIEAEMLCTPDKAELLLTQQAYAPLGAVARNPNTWHIPVCWRAGLAQGIERRCVLMRDAQMRASYEAGTITPQAALENYALFINSPIRTVATTFLSAWDTAYTTQIDARMRPKAAEYMVRILNKRIAALNKPAAQTSPDDSVLKRELLSFVALVLKDAPTRAKLLRQGEQLLGWPRLSEMQLDEPLHKDAVDPELGALVLTVAAEEHGREVIDYLVHLLSPKVSLDSGLRLQVVGALAAISTLQQAADMRSMALNSPHLRANEVMQMLRNHMRRAELRPQTWSFIKQNFLALKARLPEKDGANLAALTGQFCDAQSAQDAQAFFAPYINELAGGPRALAMAQEAIGLCTAQREAQTPGVRRFFENLK